MTGPSQRLLARLYDGGTLRISGVTRSIMSFLVGSVPKNAPFPLVLFGDSTSGLHEWAEELQAFSSRPIVIFPTWEQSPYLAATPSLQIRAARARALSVLRAGTPQPIIVTTIAAAMSPTMPVAIFDSLTVRLVVRQTSHSRDELVQALIRSGYLRVDPVEDPGTLAVRGDLIDVFPPQCEHPIRIELFDNLIERIRPFDASSQCTFQNQEIEAIQIPPAREVVLLPESLIATRERIKTLADDIGIPRKFRDPILESLRTGAYPDHADTWSSLSYEIPTTGIDYFLAAQARFLAWEPDLCVSNQEDLIEKSTQLAAEGVKAGFIVPPVSKLFPWGPSDENNWYDLLHAWGERVTIEGGRSIDESITPHWESPGERIQDIDRALDALSVKLHHYAESGVTSTIHCQGETWRKRLEYIFSDRGLSALVNLNPNPVKEGFILREEGVAHFSDREILAGLRRKGGASEKGKSPNLTKQATSLNSLSINDLVVHSDHGIGRYLGLTKLDVNDATHEFMVIEYADKDKLYIPVYRLDRVQKHIGGSSNASLDRLGGQQFEKTKNKVKNAVRKLAFDLLELNAKRTLQEGFKIPPKDENFLEFESAFPFEETPDQFAAIEDTLADLRSGKIMDRIICGDVGFGKTEVAARAAYAVISKGKQVAILVPTTVLAYQHEGSFRARFINQPFRIESISRFKSSKDQKRVLADVAAGKTDIVIGTHRLLSKDVKFKDLGMVVIDEEHRFGVTHKETLKLLRTTAHALSLSATPIPRTLHMAMAGIRDISLINTPPLERLPIRTSVSVDDDALIKRAIEFELSRGGQVYFLHNRIQDIERAATRVSNLVPRARISIAHGQMGEDVLERTMIDFFERRIQVLVCTSIIESGLDIPTANTLIVQNADQFGLAQLYQIRGRIGRSGQRAYAYLLISEANAISEDARRRLEIIQRFVDLGSGFQVASHDLEIRGGGNLLGPEQSGNIAAVGFELYLDLLTEAIQTLQSPQSQTHSEHTVPEPEIRVPFPSLLPESYVPDIHQRLTLYRRLSSARTESDLENLETEVEDRFGKIPNEVENLFWIIRIKHFLRKNHFSSLSCGEGRATVGLLQSTPINLDRLIEMRATHDPRILIAAPDRLVLASDTTRIDRLFLSLEKTLGSLILAPEKIC